MRGHNRFQLALGSAFGVSMSDPMKWLVEIIEAEIIQKREEGCDPAPLEKKFHTRREGASAQELESLWRGLHAMPPCLGWRYAEPSDLGEIKAASPGGWARPRKVDVKDLQDRMLGAWLGRCAGCLLGKPVEGWTKERIEDYLRSEDAYPLDDYFPRPSGAQDKPKPHGLYRGEIDHMPRDDDMDYTILGLHMLESFGPNVTSEQIAGEWLSRLQYGSVYTAERIAYRNLVNQLPIPDTAAHLNPYREWIGAQIRADAWGYAMPGRPSSAAELAFRDARISHVKNGIYGEMMASAMVAVAFCLGEPEKIIQAGLSVIPAKSRLSEAVRDLLKWSRRADSWQDCWSLVKQSYGHYSPVHTINNALNVVMALIYGKFDFTKTVAIAVMGGWDTDCNGATAGSIAGAALGASMIPKQWKEPLQDRVESHVRGYQECRLSDLASRATRQAVRSIAGR